jgi:hypothetical protein
LKKNLELNLTQVGIPHGGFMKRKLFMVTIFCIFFALTSTIVLAEKQYFENEE